MGDPGFVCNRKIHRELAVRLSEFKKNGLKTYLNEASSLATNGSSSEMRNTGVLPVEQNGQLNSRTSFVIRWLDLSGAQ